MFSKRKSWRAQTALLAREQAQTLLFKTPELFDNEQLLVVLEIFFDGENYFHMCTRIILRCGAMRRHDGKYTRADVKIIFNIEKSL